MTGQKRVRSDDIGKVKPLPQKSVSNWEQLKQRLTSNKDSTNHEQSGQPKRKKRRSELSEAVKHNAKESSGEVKKAVFDPSAEDSSLVDKSRYVALDCEMVGMGNKGSINALARCAVVDYDGNKIYDQFVRPPGYVTDLRTKYSGVRMKDIRSESAIPLRQVG